MIAPVRADLLSALDDPVLLLVPVVVLLEEGRERPVDDVDGRAA